MDVSRVAVGVWRFASDRDELGPVVFELAACDFGASAPSACSAAHVGHVVGTYRPVSERFVSGLVSDMCCAPGVVALGVWSETRRPGEHQLLVVAGSGDAVILVGSGSDAPRPYSVSVGPLFGACVRALTPVPADDPLVLELASIAGGA